MKKIVCSLALCALPLAFAGAFAAESAKSMTLRFATDSAQNYVSTVEIQKFADEVKAKTGGRITIEVYPGGQLGEEKACIEQLQMGAIDFTKSSLSPLTEFAPDLAALNMPYLFRSVDHMWKVMKSDIGDSFLKAMEKHQLIGLGWLDAGSRCFYSSTKLEAPDDLKGKKIRVPQSSIMMAMVESFGGTAVPMPANDIYSALQTGVVNAAENNIPRYIDMSHEEVAKNLILDRHNILPEMILASPMTKAKFSDADWAIVLAAAKNLQENMITAWEKTEGSVLKDIYAKGIKVVEPSPDVIASFRAVCQPVYDKLGAPYADLIKKIEAVQ
ncbi:MAG: TRAP transporter substrate-binding protein [Candidatus Accumulibacter sp.]|jgi:tripartite ATP-independent transporter DctP family solute receptor|nr:TRAP transporter substrate-binding protein [Accumulibacter sp.]